MSSVSAPSPAVEIASTPAAASAKGGGVRDWLLAFSIANISFYEFWHEILFAHALYVQTWTWRDLIVVLAMISLVACFFRVLIYWGRNGSLRRFELHRYLFLFPAFICCYLVWLKYTSSPILVNKIGATTIQGAALILVALGAAIVWRWRNPVLQAAEVFTFCLAMFLPMLMVQAGWVVYNQPPPPKLADYYPKQVLPNRIVIVVFDEFDWQLAVNQRPEGLELPNFERLRAETFSAEKTIQVSSATKFVLPTIISGIPLQRVKMKSEFLPVTTADGRHINVQDHNLFKDLRAHGVNVGLAGWYFSYCPIFAADLNRCSSNVLSVRPIPQLRLHVALEWFDALFKLEDRRRHLQRYEQIMTGAREMLVDDRLGLVFIHMSLPHAPGIYNRKAGETSILQYRYPEAYIGNLALTDKTIGELRAVLENAGKWDDTHVIMTSDHALRTREWFPEATHTRQVPFFIKLAGQKEGRRYDEPTQNILIHDLALELASGRMQNVDQLEQWFRERPLAINMNSTAGDDEEE